jgi:hypothetical protein
MVDTCEIRDQNAVMSSMTPLRRAVEAVVEARTGSSLTAFVARRRADGRSWRLIARDLADATAGLVDVSPEAMRRWCADSDPGSHPTARATARAGPDGLPRASTPCSTHVGAGSPTTTATTGHADDDQPPAA